MSQHNSSDENRKSSRRDFLEDCSRLAASGAAVGTSLSLARSANAAGSDVMRLGLIGCGAHGTGVAASALKHEGLLLTSMGDFEEESLSVCYNRLKRQHSDRLDVPKDQRFVGIGAYLKVLQCDIDLVIIAPPTGFRDDYYAAATEHGKHIFVEAPTAVDAPGARKVLTASKIAAEKGLCVVAGFHRRHSKQYREAVQILRDGSVGNVTSARVYRATGSMWMTKRNPNETELQYQIRNWYNFTWLSGDFIVASHVHNLDVINWIKNDYPLAAVGVGGRQVRIGPEAGNIYDHHYVEYTYPDGTRLYSLSRQIPNCWNEVSEHAQGTRGNVDITGGRAFDLENREVWTFEGRKSTGAQEAMDDLIDAIRKGDRLAEGESAARSTLTAIIGRAATYSGQRVTMEEALVSELSLGLPERFSWDSEPPVLPNEDGNYSVAIPGVTRAL